MIIDIAPSAELYISNPSSEGALKESVGWMVAQGVDVINMSLSFTFSGPGDGTSPYSNSALKSIDAAVDGGIFGANSAGNGASGGQWFGNYLDADSDRWLEFSPGDESSALGLYNDRGAILQLRWEDD